MDSPTPSPTVSATMGAPPSSRRPPRKSTLTQQQKNQKRQRATQDQLLTLEVEFNKNPTPTATVRERIAQDISMTERSVQIWFQNRYARWSELALREAYGILIDVRRSSYWRRRVSRPARIATLSPNRCARTLLIKLLSLANPLAANSSVAPPA